LQDVSLKEAVLEDVSVKEVYCSIAPCLWSEGQI
jgi:hypothetical protein